MIRTFIFLGKQNISYRDDDSIFDNPNKLMGIGGNCWESIKFRI